VSSPLSPFGVFEKANTTFQFSGFFQPVDNLPTINVVKTGSAVPVKFSLNGAQGLDIFDVGYPKSQEITCDTTSPVDTLEQTVTAVSSSLSYDAGTDQYTYVWKTSKAWATGSCRQLVVKLNDGTSHVAYFKFRAGLSILCHCDHTVGAGFCVSWTPTRLLSTSTGRSTTCAPPEAGHS
jgi:hypothetical protein